MRPRAIVLSLTAVTAFAVATSVFAVADDGTRLPAAEGGEVDALGEERQQLRWMAAAAALVVVAWLANSLLDQALGISNAYFLPIVLLALPGASAVAVLRYRLYDLGLVVNRTLVYGALTITLGATYLGLVLLVGLAVGETDLAIAASTLAVAALFRPARAHIQALVDRRFYRRRYDAERTLEAFSARLRGRGRPRGGRQRAGRRRARHAAARPRLRVAASVTMSGRGATRMRA